MWAILSHPGHAEGFLDQGGADAPLHRLAEQLARRPYAGEVFAFASMATFCLTTAATYQEAPGHDAIQIKHDPGSGLFAVGYREWISPTRNPPDRAAVSHLAEWPEVVEVIDRYVLRLLLARRAMAQAGPGEGA